MAKPPEITKNTRVVQVNANARGMTELQKAGNLPASLRPANTAVSIGRPNLEMDVDEYCFRSFNDKEIQFRGKYASLYGFGRHILSLLEDGETCPQLRRSRWDKLFDKYLKAEGSVGNVTRKDLPKASASRVSVEEETEPASQDDDTENEE